MSFGNMGYRISDRSATGPTVGFLSLVIKEQEDDR